MTQKIFLVLMLAATAMIAAQAIGQSPSGGAKNAPSLNPPAVSSSAQPPARPTTSLPTTSLPTTSGAAPTGTATKTSEPAIAPKTAVPPAGKDSARDATAKDSAATKTFSTAASVPAASSAANSSSAANRRELVLERCLVTLIDDNKIPASEPGMITKMEVKEGNTVENGFLVAEIDTRSTLAKREIARSELAAARAQAENTAEIEVARAAIEVARAELEQSEEIRKTNKRAVSESQMRKDKFNLEKSFAQEKQALNENKIHGLTAAAKQAQLDAASIELDLRQVRAPFKGEVVEVLKQVGDWVTVGEPIMHIVGLDKVKVKGFVHVSGDKGASQEEVIGKDVKITVEAAGGKKRTVAGKIGFASPVIEGVGTSRQFRIWAEVDNKKSTDPVTKQEIWDLQPGSIATMTIDLTSSKPAGSPVSASATGADRATSGKGKVESYKPVTNEKATKSTAKER